MEIKINCSNILNDYLLALFGGLLCVILLYIDKCIFFKNNDDINYISYMKMFISTSLIIYSILYLKNILINNSVSNLNNNNNSNGIDTGGAPF